MQNPPSRTHPICLSRRHRMKAVFIASSCSTARISRSPRHTSPCARRRCHHSPAREVGVVLCVLGAMQGIGAIRRYFQSARGTRGIGGTCTVHGVRKPQSPARGVALHGHSCGEVLEANGPSRIRNSKPNSHIKSIKRVLASLTCREWGSGAPDSSLLSLERDAAMRDIVQKCPGAQEQGTQPWLSSQLGEELHTTRQRKADASRLAVTAWHDQLIVLELSRQHAT